MTPSSAAQPKQDDTGASDAPEFYDAIKLHPMAGKDIITEETIIARIQNPHQLSKDWQKVGSSHSFRCKIKITKANQNWSKAPWYPNHKATDSEIELHFSLESAEGCAPRMRLRQDLRRKNEAIDDKGELIPAHTGSIDLSFGRIYESLEDNSTAPNQIFNLKADYKQQHPTAMLSFDTTGATANNLKCLIDFPEGHDRVRNLRPCNYELEMTKQLCSLTRVLKDKVKHVTIMIQPNFEEKELHTAGQRNAVDDLLDSLPSEGNVSESSKQLMTVLPYIQLRNIDHKPRLQHGQMSKPYQTYDKNHPCLPMPPRYAWQDADEAAMVLANSVEVQHKESSAILSALVQNQQEVKLLTLGDMVLIGITWDQRLSAGTSSDERITFPFGTVIELSIHDADTVKTHLAKGKVVSNIYNIACDVLVAVETKKARDFIGLTSPLVSSKIATSYWASLTAKISENSCAGMIEAVAATYARESWVTGKWPALLNDGARLTPRDLVDSVACSDIQYNQAYKDLNKAHSWNKAQRAHIDAFLKAPGGMASLTGSSGSGKTEVMVHLMRFCLRIGINVLCVGMKNSTLDLIVKKYESKFPNEEQPLRSYTPFLESLTTRTTEWQANEEDELLILEIACVELAELKNKRSRLLMTNSIQHKVIENSKRSDMPKMERRFPSGYESGHPVYTDQTLYDFRQIFREGLAARERWPFSDKGYWTDGRFSQFKFAYATLRAEVIQNARLLVATMINVGGQEISQNFSRNAPIARFDDEAQACAEQSSLIASANCAFSKNICVWAMYGDLRQSGVINLTGRRTDDTVDVFYKQSDVSLFRRLYLSGHPFVRLDIQWRQHEKLFRPLNERHYEMSIRTKGCMKSELKQHTRLMGNITGSSDGKIDAQSDYQKRLLHVIVDSPTMKAKDSKSRANPGFAAYVVRVMFPKFRNEFGLTTHENVMLLVPYAKQKELYGRWFVQLRREGWLDAELPALTTIDAARGHETHLVIFDVVNDDYEGFLEDHGLCCVAFSRAKHQMIVVSGSMSQVKRETETKIVRDATDGDIIKTITLKRPLVHWFEYYAEHLCTHRTSPPEFKVPTDLSFYDAA